MQMDTWNCQIRGARRVCSKHWVLTGRTYWGICLHDSSTRMGYAAVTCRCLSCKTTSFTRSRRLRSQHDSSVAPLVLAVCLRDNWLLAAFKGIYRSAACILKHMSGITMLSAASPPGMPSTLGADVGSGAHQGASVLSESACLHH